MSSAGSVGRIAAQGGLDGLSGCMAVAVTISDPGASALSHRCFLARCKLCALKVKVHGIFMEVDVVCHRVYFGVTAAQSMYARMSKQQNRCLTTGFCSVRTDKAVASCCGYDISNGCSRNASRIRSLQIVNAYRFACVTKFAVGRL